MKIIIPKDELYKKYITENMPRKECARFFGVSDSTIKRNVKVYNFIKQHEQVTASISNSKKIILSKDVLYKLYIEENLSMVECANVLGVSFVIIKKRLHDFGIKKPREKFKEIHKTHAKQTEKSIEKRKKTILRKYGTDNVSKIKGVQNKKQSTVKQHYGVDNPFSAPDVKKKISERCLEKYGVPYSCMRKECRKYSGNESKPNQQFANLLDSYEIVYEREFPLYNYSYDFKVENFLFEINPTIFHNSTFSPVGLPKAKTYHLDKRNVAKSCGFRCVHIFDWDDETKIVKLFLVSKQKIYARKCEVREVEVKEAKAFLEEYHLQGYARDSIRLGLYYNDELVELMTFDKPRYNKHYEYELVRLCASKNVVGGSSKLLKHFMKEYSPKNILSYCDLSKFDGNVYEKLGFKVVARNNPSKHWYNLKTGEHITDNLLRARGFDQLFKTNYGKGYSNEDLMKEHGFVEVYDCGQLTYFLELDK